MKRILAHANGKRLLEVGVGTGELIAVALEYGCEVEAVEISRRQSQRLQKLLDVDVHCMDFLAYDTSGHFDIVTMGDVIEHVTDPAAAIEKAHALLADEGVLWISTPNFESGFSRIMKYADPMWNEPWHVTYFSRDGLEDILRQNGFIVLESILSAGDSMAPWRSSPKKHNQPDAENLGNIGKSEDMAFPYGILYEKYGRVRL